MWSFITQPGVASATVDFTNDLSWMTFGLVGFVALAAALIAFTAIQQRVAPATRSLYETAPAPIDSREAA